TNSHPNGAVENRLSNAVGGKCPLILSDRALRFRLLSVASPSPVDSQFFFPSMSSRLPCKYFFNVSVTTCHSGCDVFIFDYCRRSIGVVGDKFKH
ncbi:unnamed protein product, partial [Linum tenue]